MENQSICARLNNVLNKRKQQHSHMFRGFPERSPWCNLIRWVRKVSSSGAVKKYNTCAKLHVIRTVFSIYLTVYFICSSVYPDAGGVSMWYPHYVIGSYSSCNSSDNLGILENSWGMDLPTLTFTFDLVYNRSRIYLQCNASISELCVIIYT